uniref:Uncharacterized protein n=1 Tax=Chrysoporthe deuterocubensis TaxID=764597 RepID=A0A191MWX2_9PEZI|nr:hypothetical protein [Chrysoporthe deuterocubensis]AMX22170.1 hypothetical protein [Chrysoporthe deuterocubensis]
MRQNFKIIFIPKEPLPLYLLEDNNGQSLGNQNITTHGSSTQNSFNSDSDSVRSNDTSLTEAQRLSKRLYNIENELSSTDKTIAKLDNIVRKNTELKETYFILSKIIKYIVSKSSVALFQVFLRLVWNIKK